MMLTKAELLDFIEASYVGQNRGQTGGGILSMKSVLAGQIADCKRLLALIEEYEAMDGGVKATIRPVPGAGR